MSIAVWTIILSALVASLTTLFVEKSKLKNRLRLENEYKILMELWAKAYLLKSRANNLRPMHDQHNPDESGEQRKQRRLELFTTAMDDFMNEMYLNKPFYPQRIYDLLNKLRVEAHMEAWGYNEEFPDTTKYFESAKENTKKINDIVDQLCGVIRRLIHGRCAVWDFFTSRWHSKDD